MPPSDSPVYAQLLRQPSSQVHQSQDHGLVYKTSLSDTTSAPGDLRGGWAIRVLLQEDTQAPTVVPSPHAGSTSSQWQGYPEGYYGSKSGWSSQSDYYTGYYSSQCSYGDFSDFLAKHNHEQFESCCVHTCLRQHKRMKRK
ncbi:hypothetical protein P7K49_002082 [Saguinus oedipus]|uniref:Uncharacterized protein n=1 Tax=Saguinus oedipus TaxID=9490 RepID=A0ABQ9WH94_SAGOE|nr:hypothetical protein P7K49_002082 [Saguinus oedipus]